MATRQAGAAQMPERTRPGVAAAASPKAKKSTARSRPKPTHHDERARETRAQEGRAELFERVDENQPYIKPTSLDAPSPLLGMKQRWIRVGVKGSEDEKNLSRKLREGWRARPSNTVPKGFQVPTIRHGAYAGTIMVEGMLLCHMPIKMAKRREAAIRAETSAKTRAVNEGLLRVNEGAGGGFGPIKKGERSQVVREVPQPHAAAEEEIDLT